MRSTELQTWVAHWLDNGGEDQQLLVDDCALSLRRRGGQFFALASLTATPDELLLGRALRLSAPALRHFGRDAAALLLEGDILRLALRLCQEDVDAICEQLTSLLNQRDVWQSLLQQPIRKAADQVAMPLHSLAFLPRGNHG
ncbi:type III secretion system chaperone [Serratia marcescens]|uniref:type III secretion system chaperone n=1 Tax=Serratia marcescens TaxID=615 RepID=UPI000D73BE81|nr:type III secretion system chaperone [Serratia marcescens]AWO77479.1 type III secretion system protein [Serratia marcescens]HDU5650192.1 type III secretion system protein [Klebsiella aerogenes]